MSTINPLRLEASAVRYQPFQTDHGNFKFQTFRSNFFTRFYNSFVNDLFLDVEQAAKYRGGDGQKHGPGHCRGHPTQWSSLFAAQVGPLSSYTFLSLSNFLSLSLSFSPSVSLLNRKSNLNRKITAFLTTITNHD